MSRPWKTSEAAIVRERFPHEPTADIAADLNRTAGAVAMFASKLGLKKSNLLRSENIKYTSKPWRPWSETELDTLRSRYAEELTATIAADLGRSPQAVFIVASRLGIAKTHEHRSAMASARCG